MKNGVGILKVTLKSIRESIFYPYVALLSHGTDPGSHHHCMEVVQLGSGKEGSHLCPKGL